MALPVTDSRTLDTIVTSAIDTISGNPANLVNEGGEKLLGKLAKRGRIFRVNDADRVEHPVMHGTDGDTWISYQADQFNGGAGTLGHSQNEVLSKALFSLIDRTKNFNVPQSMLGRPTQLAMSDVAYLAQRMAMETFELEEARLLIGGATTLGGPSASNTYTKLAPHEGDGDFDATKGSMSLAGLFLTGKATPTDEFANIGVDDDANWDSQLYTAGIANSAAVTGDEIIKDLQNALVKCDFGGMERPTDVLSTIDYYTAFLQELRTMGNINDTLIRDMGAGPNTEIPFGSVLVDYSRHLTADAEWDTDAYTGTGSASGTDLIVPVLGLNLNSLRWNLVSEGTAVGADAGWIRAVSELAPHPTKTNFFKRLHYKSCYSLDAGRRSFFRIEGYEAFA